MANGRLWTEDELDYIALATEDNESTVEEVASFLGRSVSSVRSKSERVNDRKGQFVKRRWSEREVATLRKYYHKVLDLKDLAAVLERSVNSLIIKADRLGLAHRHEPWGVAKADVERLAEQGMTYKEIAKELGKPVATIRRVAQYHRIGVRYEVRTCGHAWSQDNDIVFRKVVEE